MKQPEASNSVIKGGRAAITQRCVTRYPVMIPGEFLIKDGEIELNAGRKTVTLEVSNTGDRPIQVGSHYHFSETNPALKLDRKKARGSISPPAPRCGSSRARRDRLSWSRSRASAPSTAFAAM